MRPAVSVCANGGNSMWDLFIDVSKENSTPCIIGYVFPSSSSASHSRTAIPLKYERYKMLT